MKPALETVVRSSPAVCSAYPSASSRPSAEPATQPGRPSERSRLGGRDGERHRRDREADGQEREERIERDRVLHLDEGHAPDGGDGDQREKAGIARGY